MKNNCYHCHQPVAPGAAFSAEVLGENRDMCCPGCQAVANTIVDNGLEDYYRFRTESAEKSDIDLDNALEQVSVFDDQAFQQEFVDQQEQLNLVQLTVEGINCAACGWLIERQLIKIEGVSQIAVNVSARRATVKWHPNQAKLSDILRGFEKIGYHALPFQPNAHEASYQRENKSFLKRLGLAGIMTMQIMMLAIGLYFGLFGNIELQTQSYFHAISLLLCLPVVLYSGAVFYRSAFNAIKNGTVNMDVPITIAIIGAFAASAWATINEQGAVYFESVAMFIFLLLISRYLEHRSRHHAAEVSANIMKHLPVSANVIDAEGSITLCMARNLHVGQRILIRAGETIPIDGEIIDGNSQVDESMLNGEFEPVSKTVGDAVFGGATNHAGVLTVKVQKTLQNALINQIVGLQEMAFASKPRMAMLADRFSRYFVAAVLLIAALTYSFWAFHGNAEAFYITIAVLVATCPCALGLATPTALTCAIANLNRSGILIKKADVLERLSQVNVIAFDKTGTLTEGRFSIERIDNLSTLAESDILQIAASIERHSEHPIANAFAHITELLPCREVDIFPAKGIKAKLNGQSYWLGSADFIPVDIPSSCQVARVYLATEKTLLAAFYLSDAVRTDAFKLRQKLNNKKIHLVSGDNPASVKRLADELKIEHYHSQCTPEQKLQVIQELQSHQQQVLMMGDGINDSPVLAAADVSVAMGNATELTKNSADVILLNNQLGLIDYLLDIATLSNRKIRQNIGWALGYNLIVLPLAVSGLLTPWMAVLGMSLSSVIVVTNSLRILKQQYSGTHP